MLGSVLVQPQKLRRPIPDADAALARDLLDFAARFSAGAEPGSDLLEAISGAAQAAAERLRDRVLAGVPAAAPKLTAWAQPAIDFIQSFDPSSVDGAAEVADLLKRGLLAFAEMAGSLTFDQIRERVDELLGILKVDFGLSDTFLEEQVWAFVDDVVARLEQVPADATAAARLDRLAMASTLRRLKRRGRREIAFPRLDAAVLARKLLDLVRLSGLDAVARKAACLAAGMGEAVGAASAMTRVVPLTALGTGHVGAAASAPFASEEYAWYATWLLEHREQFFLVRWWPGDKVRVNFERTKVTMGDRVLFEGTDADWTKVPIFQENISPRYTFREISPGFLEDWTRIAGLWRDGLELLFHWIFYRDCHVVTTILNTVVLATDVTTNALFGMPLDGSSLPLGSWYDFFARFLVNFFCSFEGISDTASGGFLYWLIFLLGADAAKTFYSWRWPRMLHSGILSAFTLFNYKPPFSPMPSGVDIYLPENRKEIDGIVHLCSEVMVLLTSLMPKREDYTWPFSAAGATLWLFLGSLVSAFTGWCLGLGVSKIFLWDRGNTDADSLGRTFLSSWVQNTLSFMTYYYLFQEGSTQDGTYNATRTAFPGYPSPASGSPYMLPFAAGKCRQCVQGNQGMITHNEINGQTYAYDFAMPVEEILASRPGTVVDFFDWVPDDQDQQTNIPVTAAPGQTTRDNWNFITIRHDQDSGPLATYDVDENGTTTTFAVYGHGRFGSVRQIFATRLGIPVGTITPANIIGQVVQRGQPIIMAGHTGNSAFNHLHFHVVPDWTNVSGTAGVVVNRGRETIPFVFSDVPGDGVCRRVQYYTSRNTRIP
ncbi:MAG TPA: M23 family metallopeptidase [Thermoanaerobaculia bacterium]